MSDDCGTVGCMGCGLGLEPHGPDCPAGGGDPELSDLARWVALVRHADQPPEIVDVSTPEQQHRQGLAV